jgi:hypothetical protein
VNIDRFRYLRKARLLDFELIDAIGQALHIQVALIVGRQSISVLIGLADDLHRGFHGKTGRIGDFKAQFSAIALAKERQRRKEENS